MEADQKFHFSPFSVSGSDHAANQDIVPCNEPPALVDTELNDSQALADCYTSGALQAASAISNLSRGAIDVDVMMAVLEERAAAVKAGDLSGITDVLMGQVAVLSELMSVFTIRCAGAVYQTGAHERMQQYADLSLRANTALTKTIKVLADINSPKRTAVFIAQQNNAAGHQQVINGDRQENSKNSGEPENEL